MCSFIFLALAQCLEQLRPF